MHTNDATDRMPAKRNHGRGTVSDPRLLLLASWLFLVVISTGCSEGAGANAARAAEDGAVESSSSEVSSPEASFVAEDDTGAGDSGATAAPTADTALGSPDDDEASLECGDEAEGPLPKFDFEKRTHDFGTHWITARLRHRFEFTNTGDAPLVIERVRPSCSSCTASEFTKEPVAPGERGFVELELKADAEGRRQKYVDIYSNATDTKRPTKLTVIATFRQFFWIEPDSLNFGRIEQGGKFPPRQFRLSWLAERNLKLEPLEPPADHFEIESTPFEEGDRKGVDVAVRVTDSDAAFANATGDFFHENLDIRTNLADLGLRTVRLSGQIRREVQVRPARQVVEAGPAGKLRFVLAAAPGFGLAIDRVECSIDAWDARVETKAEGSWYIVHLEPKSGARLEPGNGSIQIHTNYEKHPVFRVPIEVVDRSE